MNSRTETIKYDNGCQEIGIVEIDGKEFSSGGSCVYEDENGKLRGILYVGNAKEDENIRTMCGNVKKYDTFLTSWYGEIKVYARIGTTWLNSFRDYHGSRQENRSYYFTIHGKKCRGVNYNRQWQQIVKFKEI